MGEKAPQDKPIVIGGYACMTKVGEKVEAFLGARLSDADIIQFVECVQESFISFGKFTRGTYRDSFTSEEIRTFLHQYFIRDREISDAFLTDLMVVKQTMVGGPADRITRSDLARAIEILGFLSQQFVKLNPYMKVYNFNLNLSNLSSGFFPKPEDEKQNLDQATRTLEEVGKAIGEKFMMAEQNYPLEKMESFIDEFREFSGWNKLFPDAKPAKVWTDLITIFNTIVTGNEKSEVRPRDWPVLLRQMAKWYNFKLKLNYTLKQPSLLYGDGFQNLKELFENFKEILRFGVNAQSPKIVSFSKINLLIESFERANMLFTIPTFSASKSKQGVINPQRISSASLKTVVEVLLRRGFSQDQVQKVIANARSSSGLDEFSIVQLESEVNFWFETQEFITKNFKDNQNLDQVLTGLDLIFESEATVDTSVPNPSDIVKDGPSAIFYLLEGLRPFFKKDEDQISLLNSSDVKVSSRAQFHNLSVMNVIRGLISLLMRGYSNTSSGRGTFGLGSFLSKGELRNFYNEFRDVGIEFQLFDPAAEDTPERVFRDSKLFTYSGNGKFPESNLLPQLGGKIRLFPDKMSFVEAAEIVTFNYSGGMLAQKIYKDLMNDNGSCLEASKSLPLLDKKGFVTQSILDIPGIEKECYKNNLFNILISHLQNLPLLQQEFNKFSDTQKNMLVNTLLSLVPSQLGRENIVDWSQITTTAVILHYVESVITRYDLNSDGELTGEEVDRAYEIFEPFLSISYNQQPGSLLRKGFEFFVYCGRFPDLQNSPDRSYINWGETLVRFSHFYLATPKIKIDRLGLLSLFARLMSRSDVTKAPQEISKESSDADRSQFCGEQGKKIDKTHSEAIPINGGSPGAEARPQLDELMLPWGP
ncbi:MAG: hypothetical protein K1X29_07190 [Bdellovibrionales bacterium]|nr:hypothetical protein [Bdellovibrionales bacterium]